MEKRNLYIVVVVGLILSIGLVASNYTGQITSFGTCIDNDGNDPYTPGITKYQNNNKEYKDECYAKSGFGEVDHLREKICAESISTVRYYCENGCVENAEGIGYCNKGRANAK